MRQKVLSKTKCKTKETKKFQMSNNNCNKENTEA